MTTGRAFAKAHGCGNDFILMEAAAVPESRVRELCDRRIGIGADGLIAYRVDGDRVRMRLFNADGSDGDVSGNGVRCLAAYAVGQGWMPPAHVVETPPGPRPVQVAGGRCDFRVTVDMGTPRFAAEAIPSTLAAPTASIIDAVLELPPPLGSVRVTALSMGNPHCTIFSDELPNAERVRDVGAAIETLPAFPNRTNVEFAVALDRRRLAVRFWERGVGPTASSGTGASAAVVAGIATGRLDGGEPIAVECEGGTLETTWREGESVRQTGDVVLLFDGNWRED